MNIIEKNYLLSKIKKYEDNTRVKVFTSVANWSIYDNYYYNGYLQALIDLEDVIRGS